MEQLLHLYEIPYDPMKPLICFDERPCQLIGNTLQPIPMKPGKPVREHYEYQRNGTACLFLAVEPLTGFRLVEIRERRTKIDYAQFMKKLAQHYSKVQQITVVQDNLNTHTPAAFYEAFQPEVAFQLAQKFDMRFTPKKASWLNMAEIELSAFGKQCLHRRIENMKTLKKEVYALAKERNQKQISIQWRFTKNQARDKFVNHYPIIQN